MSWKKSFISKDTQRELHKLWLMRCVWNVDTVIRWLAFNSSCQWWWNPAQHSNRQKLFLGSVGYSFLGGKIGNKNILALWKCLVNTDHLSIIANNGKNLFEDSNFFFFFLISIHLTCKILYPFLSQRWACKAVLVLFVIMNVAKLL